MTRIKIDGGLIVPVVVAAALAFILLGPVRPVVTRLSDTTYRIDPPSAPTRICTIGKKPMCVAIDESLAP